MRPCRNWFDYKVAILALLILVGPPVVVRAASLPAGSRLMYKAPPFPYNFWAHWTGNFGGPDEDGEYYGVYIPPEHWASITPVFGTFNSALWGQVAASGMTADQKHAAWDLLNGAGITDKDGDGDVDIDDVAKALEPEPELDDDVEDDPYWQNHPELKEQAIDAAVDLNYDGKLDADELFRAIDWDGDGLKGNADPDSDGDGEPDSVEKNLPRVAGDNRPGAFDANKWPDRDGDGLRDFADFDGDGVQNIFENTVGRDGKKRGDPRDANVRPQYSGTFGGSQPSFYDQRPGREGIPLTPLGLDWIDSDGDGAPDWLEEYYDSSTWPGGSQGTIAPGAKNDANVFPDSDADGIWDFGEGFAGPGTAPPQLNSTFTPPKANQAAPPALIQTTPSTVGSQPNSTPFPSTTPTPATPDTPGGSAAPEVQTPSNSSNAATGMSQLPVAIGRQPATVQPTDNRYVDPTSNAVQTANPGNSVSAPSGSSPTSPGGIAGNTSGGGSGGGGGGTGGGTGEGIGNGVVVDVPRGNSTNWMGATGGTWQQGASPDHGSAIGSQVDAFRAALANLAPNGLQAYGAAAHSLTFPIPKYPLGTYLYVTIPCVPDVTKPGGQVLENCRTILRLFCAVVASWAFFNRILHMIGEA